MTPEEQFVHDFLAEIRQPTETGRLVYSVARRLARDREFAEDLVIEAATRFGTTYAKKRSAAAVRRMMTDRGQARAVLVRILRRVRADVFRGRGAVGPERPDPESGIRLVPLDTAFEEEGEDQGDALAQSDGQSAAAASLDWLEEPRRTIADLFFVKELPQKEIAQRLRIPLNTVKWHVGEAKRALQARARGETRVVVDTHLIVVAEKVLRQPQLFQSDPLAAACLRHLAIAAHSGKASLVGPRRFHPAGVLQLASRLIDDGLLGIIRVQDDCYAAHTHGLVKWMKRNTAQFVESMRAGEHVAQAWGRFTLSQAGFSLHRACRPSGAPFCEDNLREPLALVLRHCGQRETWLDDLNLVWEDARAFSRKFRDDRRFADVVKEVHLLKDMFRGWVGGVNAKELGYTKVHSPYRRRMLSPLGVIRRDRLYDLQGLRPISCEPDAIICSALREAREGARLATFARLLRDSQERTGTSGRRS
jgi:RNA polymerase sigma factor (sigma-70 family)